MAILGYTALVLGALVLGYVLVLVWHLRQVEDLD